MMSFELFDNLFQVAALGCASIAATVSALRQKSRRCLILALAYACMSMGTLYFVLYLAITGTVPQVFYVAEISWLAAWFFFLSFQIARTEGMKRRFSWLAGVSAVTITAAALVDRAFGPSYFVSALFALTAGMTLYLSVLRIQSGGSYRETDALMVGCVILQVLLYIVSSFMQEFSHFNLYFAVDILLTLSMTALLPLTLREVKK